MGLPKYSIPNNYAIIPSGHLRGIVRQGKTEQKWLWDPVYTFLEVSKTHGKILVAHRAVTQPIEEMVTLSSYNKKWNLPLRFVDVLFGENFVYIKTVQPSTGNIGWYLLNEELTGGTFLGDFDFLERSPEMPHHMPVGKTECKIVDREGVEKKIQLITGKIEEIKKTVKIERKTPEELRQIENAKITEYQIKVETDKGVIQLVNPNTNDVVLKSKRFSEILEYKGFVIKDMLQAEARDGMVMCKKSVGDKFIQLIKALENNFHGIVLIMLHMYVTQRNPKATQEEILDKMMEQLATGWFKQGDRYFKVYFSKSIMMALTKTDNTPISVAPYIINEGDDEEYGNENLINIVNCIDDTGFNIVELAIASAEIDQTITDKSALEKWEKPYSVRKNPALMADIHSCKYSAIDVYYITGNVACNGEEYGEMILLADVCTGFKYRSKKKINGKLGEWITTNQVAMTITP